MGPLYNGTIFISLLIILFNALFRFKGWDWTISFVHDSPVPVTIFQYIREIQYLLDQHDKLSFLAIEQSYCNFKLV